MRRSAEPSAGGSTGSGISARGIGIAAVKNGILPAQLLIHARVDAGAAEEPTAAHPVAGDALIPRVVSAVVGDERCGHLGSPSSG